MKYEQNYRKASQATLVPYNHLVAVGSFTELFAVSPVYKERTNFCISSYGLLYLLTEPGKIFEKVDCKSFRKLHEHTCR